MSATDSARDASTRALAEERLRSTRLVARMRFVGIAIAFVLNELLPPFVPAARIYQADVDIFTAYFVAAGLVFVAVRRSGRAASLVGIDIAVLDMPATYLVLATVLPHSASAAPAMSGVCYFALLTMAASFALDWRRVVAAAAIGAVLEDRLLVLAHVDGATRFQVAMVMVGVAVSLFHSTRRTVELVHSVAEEQRHRDRLRRYFSPQVAAQVEHLAGDAARGEERRVTVLFADLRDFTALSETLTGDRVVETLNAFHAAMVETVFAHGGTLDKYLGDGLMAYFGAPVDDPLHARRAVECALAMQERLALLNEERGRRGEPALRMGVGLHTGPVVLGNVGAPSRLEFTAVGDTVNVAARIEQLTKTLGVPVLVSASTRAQADGAFAFRPAGVVAVKGKAAPLETFVPSRDGAATPARDAGGGS
jgi:adenylate cyclase